MVLMSTPIALNPDSRAAALRAMAAEELDVLVVGGGIVGLALERGQHGDLESAGDQAGSSGLVPHWMR